jgi:hypothetical protein
LKQGPSVEYLPAGGFVYDQVFALPSWRLAPQDWIHGGAACQTSWCTTGLAREGIHDGVDRCGRIGMYARTARGLR